MRALAIGCLTLIFSATSSVAGENVFKPVSKNCDSKLIQDPRSRSYVNREYVRTLAKLQKWLTDPLSLTPSIYVRGSAKTRLEILRESNRPASKYHRLMLAANPRFLETGEPGSPFQIAAALDQIYDRENTAPQDRVYPGVVFKSDAGEHLFLRYQDIDQWPKGGTILDGVISTDLYLEALAAGVHPLSTSYEYEKRFELPMYMHELGHIASLTDKDYRHEVLEIARRYTFLRKKTGAWFNLVGVNSFLETLVEFTSDGREKLRHLIESEVARNLDSQSPDRLLQLADALTDVIETSANPLGGSMLDQFAFRSPDFSSIYMGVARIRVLTTTDPEFVKKLRSTTGILIELISYELDDPARTANVRTMNEALKYEEKLWDQRDPNWRSRP